MKNILLRITVALLVMAVAVGTGAACPPQQTTYQGEGEYHYDTSDVDENDYVYLDAEYEYDVTETEYRRATVYEGTASASGEVGHVVTADSTTTRDFAGGEINAEGKVIERRHWRHGHRTAGYINFDGKVYQGTQVDSGRHHSYFEEGYTFDGKIVKRFNSNWRLRYLNYDYYNYSYAYTDERVENQMCSPSQYTLGEPGDKIPVLYTWAEVGNKFKHHTTEYFPAEGTYQGCVIVTPAQIVGEPIQESNFWDTAKGKRVAEWQAAHRE